MDPRNRIAPNHGPVVYVMYYVGATAKLILASLQGRPHPPFQISQLAAYMIPDYGGRIEKILDDSGVKVDSTSKLNQIYDIVLGMICSEIEKAPHYCTRLPSRGGLGSIDHLPLASEAPESLHKLWSFIRFFEKSVRDKFIWRHCERHVPAGIEWNGVLERLCEATNTSGNREGKDNTGSKLRLSKLPEIFSEITRILTGPENEESLCKKMRIGELHAAIRATSEWRNIADDFMHQKIRGPYFIYRRARSSMTNAKQDIDLIVRDFIWVLPEAPHSGDGANHVLGYYFSAFDKEVYEIRSLSVLNEPRKMLKIDATAFRTRLEPKSLFLYAPTIPLDDTGTFTLGTITGTLRDTERSGGWSCILIRPRLDRKQLQAVNTIVYSFLRYLSPPDVPYYGREIDRLREAIEGSGLSGVYTSRFLEQELSRFGPSIVDYVESESCARQRRYDVMACFCHDRDRQNSLEDFAKFLIKKHSIQDPDAAFMDPLSFSKRVEQAIIEAIFESSTSSTVPTAGFDEIVEVLKSDGGNGLFGPDGLRIQDESLGFHTEIINNLSDCSLRKTIPMDVYEKLARAF